MNEKFPSPNEDATLKNLEEENKLLRQLLEEKNQFILNWGHDIGAPINGITAVLPLLNPENSSDDIKYATDIVKKGCQYLIDIKENIQSFANGKPEVLHIEQFDLKEWLTSIIKLYAGLAEDKDIRLRLIINSNDPITIRSDKLKLTRVVSNVINNAIKFTPIGKSIYITAYNKNNLTYIEIKDEGIGIPNDKLNDIFLPYVRLDTKGPGTGIGLTICKQIMDKLGDITVESEVGKGTTFTIAIPA